MNRYEDQLPVDEEWVEEHLGERWTFTLFIPLFGLLGGGIDGLNEFCDDTIGVVLSGLEYSVGEPDGSTSVDRHTVVIEATGTIEEN